MDAKIAELRKEVDEIKLSKKDPDEFIEEYKNAKKESIKYYLMKQKIFDDK